MNDSDRKAECLTLDEPALTALAGRLAAILISREFELLVIGLSGDLGTGKTTFARALIRAAGHDGPVKSPTYGLLESYELELLTIHHLDLYRIADPEELEWLGLRELQGLMLIEWPEQGGALTPTLDIRIDLLADPSGVRRQLAISACSSRGESVLRDWKVDDLHSGNK